MFAAYYINIYFFKYSSTSLSIKKPFSTAKIVVITINNNSNNIINYNNGYNFKITIATVRSKSGT